MARPWTTDQLTAITDRAGTLLVSAAAGSGKTAVLVERVIRYILEDGKDIDDFLIVTFTNAAAAEMRGKITDAIMGYLSEHPADQRMKKQLYLVHKAQITTVHAFCLSLVRENFHRLGLSPSFRIGDERETDLLRQEVLQELLDRWYEKEDPGFGLLSHMVSDNRDDRGLERLILDFYAKLQSHARPEKFLNKLAQDYDGRRVPALKTDWGNYVLSFVREMLSYSQSMMTFAVQQAEADGVTPYVETFEGDLKQIQNLLYRTEEGDWDTLAENLAQTVPATLKRASKVDQSITKPLQELRAIWKDILEQLQSQFFFCSQEEIWQDNDTLAPAIQALLQVTQDFSQSFLQAKRNRGLVDFNDLEHFVVELLTDPEGNPTQLAQEIHYEEIMVDEYQDTNEAQDTIFRAVSEKEGNIFMVGDVKQSIYRFRMANPMIFLAKYKLFESVEKASEGQPRKVVLSKNFRSREAVLEGVNFLFKQVMSEPVGDVVYDRAAWLYCGAAYPPLAPGEGKTEFCVLDIPRKSKDSGEDSPEKAELEAQYVACRIAEMIREGYPVSTEDRTGLRPVRPSDFAILLRSRSRMALYRRELEKVGLAALSESTEGLLACTEVEVMVSLLSILDNPRQDILLIGVMRSPLFRFTEEQLAEIRLCRRDGDFYDALCLAAESRTDARDFLNTLNRLRRTAVDAPVHQLLWQLYDETGALGRYGARPDGKARQDHLMQLFEIASSYEGQGYKGLFQFVRFLRGMREQGKDFPLRTAAEQAEGVALMTIHKSKGLEYPIVFLSDCAKRFNRRDLYENVQLHENLGVGIKCRDVKLWTQHTTAQRNAISYVRKREELSEELRVLYVAMTRAKEKLIVTGAVTGLAKAVAKWAAAVSFDPFPTYAMASVQSVSDWLIAALLKHPAGAPLREIGQVFCPIDFKAADSWFVTLLKPEDIHQGPYVGRAEQEAEETLKAQPEVDYPYEMLTALPSKLTATGMPQTFRQQEAAEETQAVYEFQPLRRPRFQQEKRGLTSAEKGVAHHLAMQFMRYENCGTREGLLAEIHRLRELEIMTPEQCDALKPDRLWGFFQSSICREMKRAANIWHEFKFSVLVPVTDYLPEAVTEASDQLLLQGVMDCLYEKEGKLTILDFKTDWLTPENRRERLEAHKRQLSVYRRAAQEIFEQPVEKCVLYYFASGEMIIL